MVVVHFQNIIALNPFISSRCTVIILIDGCILQSSGHEPLHPPSLVRHPSEVVLADTDAAATTPGHSDTRNQTAASACPRFWPGNHSKRRHCSET
jgi:hypothetical protein